MNKSVLLSIQPYYVFLIIARAMGWDIPQEKTVEVRKDFPKSEDWDKQTAIYCSRNRRSFNRIPKEYQPLMAPLLGKVVGEFVCDRIEEFHEWQLTPYGKFRDSEEEDLQKFLKDSCLSRDEVFAYRENLEYYQPLYSWHISELKIYDKPKEVSDFFRACIRDENAPCGGCPRYIEYFDSETLGLVDAECYRDIRRPPQNWMYVEEI